MQRAKYVGHSNIRTEIQKIGARLKWDMRLVPNIIMNGGTAAKLEMIIDDTIHCSRV